MDTFEINLDIDKAHAYLDQIVVHRIGDTKTKIVASVFDKGEKVDLTKSTGITFQCILPDGKKLVEQGNVDGNTLTYILGTRFNKMSGKTQNAYFNFDNYSTQSFDVSIIED